MIFSSSKKSLIYNEFNDSERSNWFDLNQKKFINTIDTFYYSVILKADFTRESEDARVKRWRLFWKNIESKLSAYDDYVLKMPGLPMYFYVSRFYFGNGTYEYRLTRPDYYDIFIAVRVANSETSPMLVQLRSKALWIDGVRTTMFNSLDDVHKICEYFGIEVLLAQENRIDYCWHTNYIQAPDVFFNPVNFAKMRCSRLCESTMHVKYNGNEDYEVDYLTLGKKSSKNVFFRVYLKSKEVVEMGYKAFFLKLWLFNGIINRYDFYCLEYAYEKRSWYHVHLGRLKFYAEYGSDYRLRNQCNDILNGKVKFNYDDLKYFCDILTPPVTVVLNVEYQTMRKFTSSLVFRNTSDELEFNGIYHHNRLIDILDNYPAICDYLTTNTVRLVTPYGDENKSRRDNCPFWERLKHTKSLDFKSCAADSELVRNYDHKKNLSIVKKRALSGIAGVNLYYKGNKSCSTSEEDLIDFITSLNDNDFADYTRFKKKRIMRDDYGSGVGFSQGDRFGIVDYSTGNTINL